MTKRAIYITAFDKHRLENLIAENTDPNQKPRADLLGLAEELQRGKVVDPQQVPSTVVTMNSRVLLRDSDSGEEFTYTLVFPQDANINTGAISVLAPVGTAILGYREGDSVQWQVPSGIRTLEICKVLYQPEAAGDYTR